MKSIELAQGLDASVFSLGCMRISQLSDSELDTLVNAALDAGVNHFDHADIYGQGECETAFGRLLQKNPSLRSRMLIQSKCGIRKNQYDFSKEYILEAVEGSLRRLQVDHLDTLLLHRPDALMEPEEIAEAFDRLEQAGKVRYFGVSNFNPVQCQLLQFYLKQNLIANQLQFSLMHTGMVDFGINTNTKFDRAIDRDGGILDYCHWNGIAVQAWSPFQYGFFEGIFIDNEKFPELNRALDEIGKKHQVSKSAVAAAWLLRHPAKVQVICGTTKPERLKDMCTAADIELTRSEWYQLYLAAGNTLP